MRTIIGIPVLKDGAFLNGEIRKYLNADYENWSLLLDYHLGGYARSTPELDRLIEKLNTGGIQTEFVYTGKLFWAVKDLLKRKFFERGSTVLMVHTGGLRTAM